ncbi:hypothetical protein BH09MYX1_BH09MYX1_68060 [soil metagenome]
MAAVAVILEELDALAVDLRIGILNSDPNFLDTGVHDALGTTQVHVIEKLGAASRLLEGNHEKRFARWRLWLLNVENAALDILGELRVSGREHVRVGETEPVHDAITYLDSHDHMNFAALRAAGLPIGSGNTEATCKTLVEVRMKRAGSRWNADSARHIIQLRALATSDRWARPWHSRCDRCESPSGWPPDQDESHTRTRWGRVTRPATLPGDPPFTVGMRPAYDRPRHIRCSAMSP